MDFTSVFNGESLTLEQFAEKTKGMKLADLSTGEYVAKGKDADQKAKIAALEKQISEQTATIAAMEKAKGDAAAVQAELDRYKQAEADRKKEEEAARLDAILTQTAEGAMTGKEFVNEFTRAHFVNELKKAIGDPANKDKKPADLLEAMTRDVDGIFKNPQQEPVKIPGVTGNWNTGGDSEKMMRQVMGLPPVKGDK